MLFFSCNKTNDSILFGERNCRFLFFVLFYYILSNYYVIFSIIAYDGINWHIFLIHS